MYFLVPFLFIAAATTGLGSFAFGRQSRIEKQSIALLLTGDLFTAAYIYAGGPQ
jgi:hypothetical protein